MARLMLLEVTRRRGRPILLAAKVPQNLAGCRVDGLDVETWARQRLVDIFTLGSRSMDVDVVGYRRITVGRDIQLQPCFDDHHTTDGYRYPPIELFRGMFGNWWQQGADSVATFNWSNAPPEWCRKVGAESGPRSQREAYHEVGSLETLRLKNKIFAVERRGGYPWAEGYFGRNDTAPLPLRLTESRPAARLIVRICDDCLAHAGQIWQVRLRCILFGARDQEQLNVQWNGVATRLADGPRVRGTHKSFHLPSSRLPAAQGTIGSIHRNTCCDSNSRSIAVMQVGHESSRDAACGECDRAPAKGSGNREVGSPSALSVGKCSLTPLPKRVSSASVYAQILGHESLRKCFEISPSRGRPVRPWRRVCGPPT